MANNGINVGDKVYWSPVAGHETHASGIVFTVVGTTSMDSVVEIQSQDYERGIRISVFNSALTKITEKENKMKIGPYEVTITSPNSARVGCQDVTREDVQKVLEGMDVYKTPKVGSFVKVVKSRYDDSRLGEYGKVVELAPPATGFAQEYAVEFPRPSRNRMGATSGNRQVIAAGQGGWYNACHLEVVG